MRSDNGGEYISNKFKSLLTRHGIKHELSAPHSPHQNGTAERNWRTLFDMARALLIESGLPKYLWTYALMTATHIRNRCYVQRIKTTPYEMITGIKPNLSKLHIFGTLCYPFITGTKMLDPRYKRGYFIGYDRESPAYLVYYPETRTVIKHRLVTFTERLKNDDDDEQDNMQLPTDEADQTATKHPADEPRYPRRNRAPPRYPEDYDQSEHHDSVNHIDFCYLIDAPLIYSTAMNRDDSPQWKAAMDEQMKSLKSNST